ncbi:MAG: CopG family transcriptional regulator [Actinobacteria bacterium]|nr:CopG family transcriptional regulator [Actinomycetota bacterium]MBL7060676.1 CopG family transcriptional regulator [Actinomycetota bacterium]
MKRTQIYLNDEQYNNLIIESKKTNKTISELIRESVNYKFGITKKIDFNKAVDTIAGLWENRNDIKSSKNYIDNIRKDKRIYNIYKNKYKDV